MATRRRATLGPTPPAGAIHRGTRDVVPMRTPAATRALVPSGGRAGGGTDDDAAHATAHAERAASLRAAGNVTEARAAHGEAAYYHRMAADRAAAVGDHARAAEHGAAADHHRLARHGAEPSHPAESMGLRHGTPSGFSAGPNSIHHQLTHPESGEFRRHPELAHARKLGTNMHHSTSGYARGGGDTSLMHNKVVHEGRAGQRVDRHNEGGISGDRIRRDDHGRFARK